MDWTEIITGLITAASAIGVAYLTFGKKNNQANVAEILEKARSSEEQNKELKAKLESQGQKLAVLSVKMTNLETANLLQQRELVEVKKVLDDDNLRTMRLDLLHAIETDPNNTMVILELAQKYFVELKGNCYMSSVFQEWAANHKVNISSMFNRG